MEVQALSPFPTPPPSSPPFPTSRVPADGSTSSRPARASAWGSKKSRWVLGQIVFSFFSCLSFVARAVAEGVQKKRGFGSGEDTGEEQASAPCCTPLAQWQNAAGPMAEAAVTGSVGGVDTNSSSEDLRGEVLDLKK